MAQPGFATSDRTQEKLVAEAVDYFQAMVSSNAVDAAASRAAHYAGGEIWTELTRDWSGRNCKWLARLARVTLNGKDWLHGRIGKLAVLVMEALGMPRIICLFGREIAKRIPMPWDHQLVMVARGMQIAGIVICVLNDKEVAKCSCFVDVVVAEGKERLQQLMSKAAGDWSELEEIVPTS